MSSDERKWRKAVAWGLSSLVLFAAMLWIVNATAFPLELARRAVGLVSDQTGWTFDIGSARFVGPTRLLIEDVQIAGPSQISGSAPRAYVAFNPLSLLGFGRSDFDWGRVDLVGPHFIVPSEVLKVWRSQESSDRPAETSPPRPGGKAASPRSTHTVEINVVRGTLEERRAPGPSGLWRADGEFVVSLGGAVQLRARHIDLEMRTDHVSISAEGSGDDLGVLEWKASGPADLVLSLIAEIPWKITGAMRASGTYDLDRAGGELSVEIVDGDVRWSGVGSNEWVPFDKGRLEIEHAPDRYAVRRIELVRADAQLTGEGVVWPAARGDSQREPHLEISLAAKGLSLPDDIPSVQSYGLSGRAEFTGVLGGTFADPEISGRLKVADGTVWHRPVDRGEGVILLRSGLFRFGKTEIVRGEAKYDLHGEWTGAPSRTRIELTSTNGQIKEMLLAAGIDIDVAGVVDGSFSIAVDESGPRVQGDGEAERVRVFGQALDAVAGRFTWSPEQSRLEGVRLRLGEGVGTASGEIVNGALNVAVTTERWPVPEAIGASDRLSGWLSFAGTVSGSTVDPMVHGNLRDGLLNVGSWTIANPLGDVVITRELVHITRLRGQGAGNGTYELSGDIYAWTERPEFDLDISVERASLSGLLDQGGLRLPALLFDGEVSGSISLEGSAHRPKAAFDLSLRDDLGVGDPMRLRFQVDEGKIKLGRIAELFGIQS